MIKYAIPDYILLTGSNYLLFLLHKFDQRMLDRSFHYVLELSIQPPGTNKIVTAVTRVWYPALAGMVIPFFVVTKSDRWVSSVYSGLHSQEDHMTGIYVQKRSNLYKLL